MAALTIPREICRSHAMRFTWRKSIEQFLDYVVPVDNAHARMKTFMAPHHAGLV